MLLNQFLGFGLITYPVRVGVAKTVRPVGAALVAGAINCGKLAVFCTY